MSALGFAEDGPGGIGAGLLKGITRPKPQSGMIRLTSRRGTEITIIRNGDIDRSGGVGGWQQSERYLREDADWWKSYPKPTVSIPGLLDIDAQPAPGSIEQRLNTLYGMGHTHGDAHPPGIRLAGDAPHCTHLTWKLDDIRLGAALYQPEHPSRLRRIEFTLELSKLTLPDPVGPVSVKRTRTHGRRRRRTIHAHRGDTLRAIAVRELGKSNEYKQLRDWNPKLKRVDPDQPLRPGTPIVLR